MPRISWTALLLCICLLAAMSPAAAQQEDVPGQNPVLLVDRAFVMKPGAWARYRVVRQPGAERSVMYMAVLGRTVFESIPAMILELGVTPEGDAEALTRVVATETPAGPGEVLEVAVQVSGYEPFLVPHHFYADEGGQAAEFHRLRRAESVKRRVTIAGKRLEAWEVTGKDQQGRPFRAVVSEQVAPLGLISVHTEQMDMELLEWGQGATGRMTGEPMNFYLWLALRIGGALAEPEKR